jgi:predicted O-methyltransferase YrrM
MHETRNEREPGISAFLLKDLVLHLMRFLGRKGTSVMKIKRTIMRALPRSGQKVLHDLKRSSIRGVRRLFAALGYVVRESDYYSPLPSEFVLERNKDRWNKPSTMAGISFDVDLYKTRLSQLTQKYADELRALPSYAEVITVGFGPGFPEFDGQLLYMMLRETKPRRYLEVGSGVSTYYCTLAAARNSEEGYPLAIQCIEPFPYEKLRSLPGVDIVQSEVQDVAIELFMKLEENDVFFIDSSHVLTIDGDVPFLFLEVLPRIQKGVLIHVHDIPFPHNIPYPAEFWVFGRHEKAPYWPMYWNEAMVLQAFLAFNSAFEIEMSTPMIRHHDEPFLASVFTNYKSVEDEPNTFSSIWIRKTA